MDSKCIDFSNRSVCEEVSRSSHQKSGHNSFSFSQHTGKKLICFSDREFKADDHIRVYHLFDKRFGRR